MRKLTHFLSIIVIAILLLGGGGTAPVSAAPTEWSVPMTATTATEGNNPNLEFGTRAGATDGYDSGVDVGHLTLYGGIEEAQEFGEKLYLKAEQKLAGVSFSPIK